MNFINPLAFNRPRRVRDAAYRFGEDETPPETMPLPNSEMPQPEALRRVIGPPESIEAVASAPQPIGGPRNLAVRAAMPGPPGTIEATDTAIAKPPGVVVREAMPGPAESIEATDAPVRNIYRPSPDFVGEARRRSIADPEMRLTALGASPAERRVLEAPVPENELEPYNPHAKRGGVLGTLKNIGKGFLLSASQADPRAGLGGILGAGLTGAVAGGASPEALEWADYKTRRLPEFQQQQAIATKDAANRQEITRRIGDRTGFDPSTGEELPETRRRRIAEEMTAEQRGWIAEDRARDNERQTGEAAERARHNRAMEEAAANRAEVPRNVQTFESTAGLMERDPVTGVWRVANSPVGPMKKPVTPGASLPGDRFDYQQRRDAERDAKELDKEARELKGKFEAVKSQLTAAAVEFGQMETALGHAKAKGEAQGVYKGQFITDEDIQVKKAEADALQAEFDGLKQVAGEHPNLEFDASGAGLRFRSARRAGAGGGQGSTKDPRIGKTATLKDGSRVRITGIDSAGNPITEPL